MDPDLWTVATLGGMALAGAGHCVAMCGGLALVVAGAQPLRSGRLLGFVAGKALGYAVLGLALATGAQVVASPWPLAQARAWLAVATGVLLCAAGIRARLRGPTTLGADALPGARAASSWLQRLSSGSLALPGVTGGLAGGLAASLLPCGLSWSALLVAAGMQPLLAAAAMLGFGLATAPALLALPVAQRLLPLSTRARLGAAVPLVLVAAGLWSAARGAVVLTDGPLDAIVPACCAE